MVRAAIYARISSDREGDQLGVRRQLEDCERMAEQRGWQVAERYVDDDVSAYNGRVRPEYQRMLADLRSGHVEAVAVWHADRLHRHPRELEEFMEVCTSVNVTLLASVSGDIDLATHDGQFLARILGAVSRKESDDKSRRAKRKHQELAEAGKIAGGGTRPYGYESDKRTIRESEAAVIRECARQLLAGESLRSLCSELEERGVPTVTGAPWKTQTLRRSLMSGRISGQREHHGELFPASEWPAIISPAETTRIRALLNDPSRRTNRSVRRYLLVRLLRCGHCGEFLVSRPRAGGARGYVCAVGPNFSGCGRISALAEPLEQLVLDAVFYRLDSAELASALTSAPADEDGNEWQRELERSQAQLEELAIMYADREISRPEWRVARAPIEQRITDARKRLSKLTRTSVLDGHVGSGADLREQWTTLPLSRQHAIVSAVLDHVIVGPGRRGLNRFDPSRFQPVWRL